MRGKKVVVIGGSIAGCAAAIMLQRSGAQVIILEKSSGRIGAGSGVSLPEVVVNQCIEHDLFDKDSACLAVSSRSFVRTEEYEPNGQKTFWTQPIRAMMFNWVDIYQNLRKRIAPENYHTQVDVHRINKLSNAYQIETSTGQIYQADLIVAADGVDSTVRACLVPEVQPEYAGYVAWRGVLDEADFVNDHLFNEHVPYYVFPKGHILLYRIPGLDYPRTGKTLLNWVMYEDCREISLNELLIDKQGKQRARSVPAGMLTTHQLNHLHQLAQLVPTPIRELIRQTPQPFIQVVFDFQLPTYACNHIIFVGDAAATLRPHTASGVFNALINALELARLIESNPAQELTDYVAMWKENQQVLLREEIQKAKCMGAALVSDPPDWKSMNQELTQQWWAQVMQGKTWYATAAAEDRNKRI